MGVISDSIPPGLEAGNDLTYPQCHITVPTPTNAYWRNNGLGRYRTAL